MKQLALYAGEQLVGFLQENDRYELVFSYSPQWLIKQDAYALSANLPLTEQTHTGRVGFYEPDTK